VSNNIAGARKLQPKEMKAIIEQMSMRDRVWFILGCSTGLRISELLSLQVKDVFDGKAIKPFFRLTGVRVKKGVARNVTVTPMTHQLLKEWLGHVGNDPECFLFQSREGKNKPITRQQADVAIRKAARNLGLSGKVATHSMRKTFAWNIYELGGYDINLVREAVGHAYVTTTQAYLGQGQEKVQKETSKHTDAMLTKVFSA